MPRHDLKRRPRNRREIKFMNSLLRPMDCRPFNRRSSSLAWVYAPALYRALWEKEYRAPHAPYEAPNRTVCSDVLVAESNLSAGIDRLQNVAVNLRGSVNPAEMSGQGILELGANAPQTNVNSLLVSCSVKSRILRGVLGESLIESDIPICSGVRRAIPPAYSLRFATSRH